MDLETFKNELKKKKPNANLNMLSSHDYLEIKYENNDRVLIRNEPEDFKTYIDEELYKDKFFPNIAGFFSHKNNQIEVGLGGKDYEIEAFCAKNLEALKTDPVNGSEMALSVINTEKSKNRRYREVNHKITIKMKDGSCAIIGAKSMNFSIHELTFELLSNNSYYLDSTYTLTYKPKSPDIVDNLEEVSKVLNSILISLYWMTGVRLGFRRVINGARWVLNSEGIRDYQTIEDVKPINALYESKTAVMYVNSMELHSQPNFHFLALYQILEYYFQVHAKESALNRIKSFVKDPESSLEITASNILMYFKDHKGEKYSEGELEMLKDVLSQCIGKEELRSMALSDERLKSFYSNNNKLQQVTSKLCAYVELKNEKKKKNPGDTFFNQIAERIYDIRCKIVHSKKEWGKDDFILPHSEAYNKLYDDIIMLDRIVRKVMIHHSDGIR